MGARRRAQGVGVQELQVPVGVQRRRLGARTAMSIDNEILAASRERRLLSFHSELSQALNGLPWWRLLRRHHLERQLRLVGLCAMCYGHGKLHLADDYSRRERAMQCRMS